MADDYSIAHPRRCSQCGQQKPATLEFFHSHANARDGLNPRCKECRRSESRAYYLANLERVREQSRAWQAANPEKANARKKAWASLRPDSERQRKREYKNRNREVLRAREAARVKAREQSDPAFRLRRLMSRRMWMALKKAKDGWSWEALVGYSRADLKAHLEKQFTRGMTWDRFAAGEIHIDHITPVAAFNCPTPEGPEFMACWALANLRPMWASENCSKGAKIVALI